MMHESDGPRCNDNRRMLSPPGAATTDPWREVMQVPTRLLGLATCRPLGRVSVNAMLAKATLLLGLLTAKGSLVVPVSGMLSSGNALIRSGGVALNAGLGASTGRAGRVGIGAGTRTGGCVRTGGTGAGTADSPSPFPLNFQCGQ